MKDTGAERRRYRRIPLRVRLLVKRTLSAQEGSSEPGETKDVSLAGVYFTTATWKQVQPHEVVTVSVAVPRDQTRDFPFSRLAGRARVVRVETIQGEMTGEPRLGVALEFGDDLTVLTAAPEHGW